MIAARAAKKEVTSFFYFNATTKRMTLLLLLIRKTLYVYTDKEKIMARMSDVPVTLRPRGQQMASIFWPAAVGLTAAALLLVVGYMWFRMTGFKRPFPPAHALCPDLWTRLADGRCQCHEDNKGLLPDSNFASAFDGPLAAFAVRRNWARKHQILWDGITNRGSDDDDVDWKGTA